MPWYDEGKKDIVKSANHTGAVIFIMFCFWLTALAASLFIEEGTLAYKFVHYAEQIALVCLVVLLLTQLVGDKVKEVYRQIVKGDENKLQLFFGLVS